MEILTVIIGVDKKGEFAILLGAYGVPETYVVRKRVK